MKPSGSGVKRWLVRVIVAAVLLVAVAIGVCAYLGISTSLHAEKTLHAINLVTVVVDRFIQQEQRWPNSWDDLRSVQTVDAPSMYSWPDDADIIQEFVTIDFNGDLTVIALQTADDFDAIEPIGSYYPHKDYGFVDSLIESAKTATSGQQSVPAKSGIHAGTPSS